MVLTVARRLPAAALCALAAHALVYGTFTPADGMHGYFGWYEPLVGVLSIAAVVLLLAFLGTAWLARRIGRTLLLRPGPVGSARGLAFATFVFLVGQETLERSLASGSFAPVSFTPSGWLLLLVGVGAASLLLTAALRLCRAAVERLLATKPPARRTLAPGWSVVVSTLRPWRPLAVGCALRAPPLLGS
jgi:hypothetical protein